MANLEVRSCTSVSLQQTTTAESVYNNNHLTFLMCQMNLPITVCLQVEELILNILKNYTSIRKIN